MIDEFVPRRRIDRRLIADNGIYVVLLVLIIAFTILSDAFSSSGNAANVGRQAALVLLAGYAMTLVIIVGEIDLSVGASATLVGVVTAMLLDRGTSAVGAVAVGILVGCAIGVMNGVLVVGAGLPSFIATLGLFYTLQGLARSVTDGSTVLYDNRGFRETFSQGDLLGIPNPVLLVIVIGVLLHIILGRTRFGYDVYATGGDAESAAMVGVRVRRTKFLVFTLAGAIMALAAFGPIARVGNARPDSQIGLEFDAIAAVVIGGTSFTGGRGSISRTVIGALVIAIVNNGLTLLDVQRDVQLIIKGGIIVAAVLIDRWARGNRK